MTGYNSQTAKGEYKLQFETDDYDKFRYVEEAARRCVDNRRIEVCSPVVHAHWIKNRDRKEAACSVCTLIISDDIGDIEKICHYCPSCGSKMDEEATER